MTSGQPNCYTGLAWLAVDGGGPSPIRSSESVLHNVYCALMTNCEIMLSTPNNMINEWKMALVQVSLPSSCWFIMCTRHGKVKMYVKPLKAPVYLGMERV